MSQPLKTIKPSLLISILLISFTSFSGGPWTQQKGKGYFKLSQSWIQFDQHYTSIGKITPNVMTGIYSTSLYGEYGITNRLTTTLYFPFLARNSTRDLISESTGKVLEKADAVTSFGDSDLGIKYSLTKPGNKYPVAVSLIFGIPLGKEATGVNHNLQTGDGEFNQMISLDAGRGFKLSNKVLSYVTLNLGFNHRTNHFSEEVRYGIECGIGFKDKLWLIARSIGVESLKNGAAPPSPANVNIFSNNTEYNSLGIELAYYFTKRWGVSTSYTTALRAENIAAAPAYNAGIFYDLSK